MSTAACRACNELYVGNGHKVGQRGYTCMPKPPADPMEKFLDEMEREYQESTTAFDPDVLRLIEALRCTLDYSNEWMGSESGEGLRAILGRYLRVNGAPMIPARGPVAAIAVTKPYRGARGHTLPTHRTPAEPTPSVCDPT